jgi:hypothetical protein
MPDSSSSTRARTAASSGVFSVTVTSYRTFLMGRMTSAPITQAMAATHSIRS